MIGVKVMPGTLLRNGVPALIRIYGGPRDISNILFVKTDDRRGKGKNGESVDPLVSEKTPIWAECGSRKARECQAGKGGLFHVFAFGL